MMTTAAPMAATPLTPASTNHLSPVPPTNISTAPMPRIEQGARKVRLQQHQRRHHPQHQRKGKHAHGEAFHLVVVEGNDMAEHQHHREFGNFAGLQRAQPGQHQPALAAVVLRHKEHGHQQNEGESQQRPGQLMENMIIHPAGQPQAHQPQRRV